MEISAFPSKFNSISTDILPKCSKLHFFLLESLEDALCVWDVFSKGKAWIKKVKTCCYSNLLGLHKFQKVFGSAKHRFGVKSEQSVGGIFR